MVPQSVEIGEGVDIVYVSFREGILEISRYKVNMMMMMMMMHYHGVCAYKLSHTCGCQMAIWCHWIYSSTMWVPGVAFRFSVLAGSAFSS